MFFSWYSHKTPNGDRKIENITENDIVYGYDFKNSSISTGVISKTMKKRVSTIYQIKIDKEEIWVTGEHPFYVPEKGWRIVKDLVEEDKVWNMKQYSSKIISIEKYEKEIFVFNITVNKLNNYYINSTGYLVYNKND